MEVKHFECKIQLLALEVLPQERVSSNFPVDARVAGSWSGIRYSILEL